MKRNTTKEKWQQRKRQNRHLRTVQRHKDNVVKLPITLNETHEAVLFDPHRFRVVNAGRGWGKTLLILGVIYDHLKQPYTDAYGVTMPWKVWYIAPVLKEAKEIFWGRLKSFFAPMTDHVNESELSVYLKNGGVITIKGANHPDSLRGPYLTLCIFDEAAFHKKVYWNRVIRPMLGKVRPYGKACFLSTPDGHNEFYDLFQKGALEDKHWKSWHYTSLEGGFMSLEEINEAKKDMTYEDWRQEYYGDFIASAGRVYYTFDRTIHVKPVKFVPGLDIHLFWDFNQVPACHVGLAHVYNDKVYVFDEIAIGNTDACTAEFMKRIPREKLYDPKTGQAAKLYIYGDCSGDRSTTGLTDYMLVEHMLSEAGYPAPQICVTSSNPLVKDRVNSVNVKLFNAAQTIGILINPTCTRLVKDLELVKWDDAGKIDKLTDRKLTHISDGLGYFIWSLFPVESPSTRALKSNPKYRIERGGVLREAT